MIDRIGRQVSFFAPAAVMSAWATVMLYTIATGRISHLLSPIFRNYVLIAAIVLLALSVLYLWLYQPTQETAPALAPTGRLRQLGRWLMLLLPVLAAAVLSPTALSSTTAAMRGPIGVAPMPTITGDVSAKLSDLSSDPNAPAAVEVTDLIALAQMPDKLKALDGHKVHTVAQLMAQPGQAPKAVRWIMWCCAADAQPATVELTGNVGGNWKSDQWLEITGTAQFPSTLGHIIPRIDVDTITPTQEPDEPFLSP
jgi:uncharacterized repeat protein (TIGR03943 family)